MTVLCVFIAGLAHGAERQKPVRPSPAQPRKPVEVRCEFVREVTLKAETAPNVESIRLKALGSQKVCMGWAKCVVRGITRFTQVACTSPQNSDCKNATQCFLEEGTFEPSPYEGAPRPGAPADAKTDDRKSTGGAE